MKCLMKYILSIVITSLMSVFANAADDEAQKYQKCMDLVDSDAGTAVTYANDWIFGAAGKVPAGHCKALGLLALGKAKDAAILLEKLVDDMVISGDGDLLLAKRNDGLKRQLHVQAALAWKEAGDLDKSYMAYSAALSGVVEDTSHINRVFSYNLYLERGTLQILRGQYKSAIKDFTLAIEKDDRQFEGYLQRAKAYRKKRSYLEARLDLKVALILEAEHPGILLESGILYREQGQKLEAGLEWQKIVDIHPESDYATLARTNLELLKSQL